MAWRGTSPPTPFLQPQKPLTGTARVRQVSRAGLERGGEREGKRGRAGKGWGGSEAPRRRRGTGVTGLGRNVADHSFPSPLHTLSYSSLRPINPLPLKPASSPPFTHLAQQPSILRWRRLGAEAQEPPSSGQVLSVFGCDAYGGH